MKKLTILSLSGIALFALGSCGSMKMSKSAPERDDVYYSLKDAKADRKAAAKAKEEEEQRLREEAEARELAEAQRVARSKPGSDYYDQPFEYDDYYDYEYAARLRRFGPGAVGGYGYYDPFYTNSYFYTGNPYNYGTSIYNGYSFWGPQYQMYNYNPSSFWYWNQGWGWGIGSGLNYVSPVYMYPGMGYTPGWGNPYWNNPWGPTYGVGWGAGWGSWYDPWQTWGYYNPNWNGFCPNYMTGMNGQFYDNLYFNSFDENSGYYGPRRTTSGVGGRGEAVQNGTLGERFMNEIAAENGQEQMTREEVNNTLHARPATQPVYGVNTNSSAPAAPQATEGRNTPAPAAGSVTTPPAPTVDRGTPAVTDRNTPSPSGNSTPPLPPRPRVSDAQPSVSPNATPSSSSGSTPRSNTSRPRAESSSPSPSPSPSFESSPRSSGSSSSGSSSSPRSSGSSGSTSRPR
ncbi:MAG: hypothetical protein IM638_11665 [Bacteroidetes bacterium]|nr:hypothetical protein [Bacteroidota bacterium]